MFYPWKNHLHAAVIPLTIKLTTLKWYRCLGKYKLGGTGRCMLKSLKQYLIVCFFQSFSSFEVWIIIPPETFKVFI